MPQLLTLCPGGEDAGRMLLLRACAAAMANQDDQTPVLAVIKVRPLSCCALRDCNAHLWTDGVGIALCTAAVEK